MKHLKEAQDKVDDLIHKLHELETVLSLCRHADSAGADLVDQLPYVVSIAGNIQASLTELANETQAALMKLQ
jgi:hypothetical protein